MKCAEYRNSQLAPYEVMYTAFEQIKITENAMLSVNTNQNSQGNLKFDDYKIDTMLMEKDNWWTEIEND